MTTARQDEVRAILRDVCGFSSKEIMLFENIWFKGLWDFVAAMDAQSEERERKANQEGFDSAMLSQEF
jgi:hypothetical protein